MVVLQQGASRVGVGGGAQLESRVCKAAVCVAFGSLERQVQTQGAAGRWCLVGVLALQQHPWVWEVLCISCHILCNLSGMADGAQRAVWRIIRCGKVGSCVFNLSQPKQRDDGSAGM
jgi:hypothetical protein